MVSQATHCIQELMFAMDITILNWRKLLLGNWGSEYGVIPKEQSWCMICVWKIPHSVLSKYQVIIWIRWWHIAPNPHGQLPFPKSCLILNVYGDPVSFCTRPGCNRTWIYIDPIIHGVWPTPSPSHSYQIPGFDCEQVRPCKWQRAPEHPACVAGSQWNSGNMPETWPQYAVAEVHLDVFQ